MIGKFENLEVRGYEEKVSKIGNRYLIVRAEDETGKLNELMDKNLDRAQYYKKGTQGDFYLQLTLGRYTNVEIKDFKIHDDSLN